MTHVEQIEREFFCRIDNLTEEAAASLCNEWEFAGCIPRYAVESTGARVTGEPLPAGHPGACAH